MHRAAAPWWMACSRATPVTVAIDNAVSYPVAVHPGDLLTAQAQRDGGSGRLGWYRVEVRNQHDAVVGLFRGTVYRTRQQHSR